MAAVSPARWLRWPFALLFTLTLGSTASAQSALTPPPNSFGPAEDIELGRDAAAVLRKQLPMLTDGHVDRYVGKLGRRLVASIPKHVRQTAFEYEFAVLNAREVSSLALPGGPVFISRGMIELADMEGALAGLIAHELSHVVLRHATAQATSGERYQIGAITGRAIGAVASGQSRGIIERGADFAVGTYMLMYDREYERQADLLTARIMARAGYDPNELGIMMQSISGHRAGVAGLRWMMSHPTPPYDDPGMSRIEAIGREAMKLDIEGVQPPLADDLEVIQMRLAELPLAPSGEPGPRALGIPTGTIGYRVVVPGGESRSVTAGDLLQLNVPANWRRLQAGNTVIFAPDGAFMDVLDHPMAFTHGVQVGIARSLTGTLKGDLQALLVSYGRDNAYLNWTPAYQRVAIGGRSGLTTTVSNVSPVTGEFEYVSVSATHLADGSFLYVVGIAPQEEAGVYRNAFNRVLESLQTLD